VEDSGARESRNGREKKNWAKKSQGQTENFSSPTFFPARSDFPSPHYLPLGSEDDSNSGQHLLSTYEKSSGCATSLRKCLPIYYIHLDEKLLNTGQYGVLTFGMGW